MTRDQIFRYTAIFAVMVLVFSPVLAADVQIQNTSISLNTQSNIPSSTFDITSTWDSLFGGVSSSWMQNFVQEMSENFPHRTWYTLDKAPSPNLEGAWGLANTTLKAETNNELSFKIMTPFLNLVAIKNGTESNIAPIIVAGTIGSRYSPAANAYAASVAGVLHVASILKNVNLTNDVYFVLVNTYQSYHTIDDTNPGMEALIELLLEQGRRPAALLWFDHILFESDYSNGEKLAVQYGMGDEVLDGSKYLAFLSTQISELSGNNRAIIKTSTNDYWDESGAAEAVTFGIPSILFSQYYIDYVSASDDDVYNYSNYTYAMLREAAGVASCIISYLGHINQGNTPLIQDSVLIPAGEARNIKLYLTGISSFNASLSWSDSTTIVVNIRNRFNVVVLTNSSSNNLLFLNYSNTWTREHTLRIRNTGTNSTTVQYNYTHFYDFDQDGLTDNIEPIYGTDAINSDSDFDLADDYSEVMVYGSDPLIRDTDSDGAIDGIEIMLGSDPTVVDTDGDTLSDGFEIDAGYSPSSNDTDEDNIADNIELELGLNPLSNDTDQDGLLDYQELVAGTDGTSPDSDGDGLSDLFELLNYMNPLSQDSDQDGLSDAYEIEHCLMPNNADTDSDSIPDNIDWAPREHWINIVPVVSFGVFLLVMCIWLLMKKRTYSRGV
ncbi:MAG: hypothetical protein GF411_09065 [Candidatus Lokiarchaeota archaeon]|nr:hypothetical protein [Candidatus Lokiarchaeota archaeon]